VAEICFLMHTLTEPGWTDRSRVVTQRMCASMGQTTGTPGYPLTAAIPICAEVQQHSRRCCMEHIPIGKPAKATRGSTCTCKGSIRVQTDHPRKQRWNSGDKSSWLRATIHVSALACLQLGNPQRALSSLNKCNCTQNILHVRL
jgi:hypothetical protein